MIINSVGVPNSQAGLGNLSVVAIGNPAAGAAFNYVVPACVRARFRSLALNLQSSVAAANRQVFLQLQDGAGNVLSETSPVLNQAASLNIRWIFSLGGVQFAPVALFTDALHTLPAVDMLAGWKIVCLVSAIQAADQISAIQIVQELF